MSTFKRRISLLLVLGILLGVIAPVAQAAPVEETALVNTDNVTIEGTNGFGNLLAQEIAENQQETETENESYPGRYSVTDLEIVDNVATVTYDSMEDATLVVALHTEDGMQLLTSATVTVAPDATVATVTFEGEMPEYFLASAYLLDQYDYSPLCASYETPMYTREMQELLASTVNDYDPERVLNLDNDDTTNFAVYADSTIIIEPVEGQNTVASIDDENATYVIKNADKHFSSLEVEDIFAYSYGENELLIVKVASIAVDGTTVTITGAELEMNEVFDVVKMETFGDTEDFIVDESRGADGITYLGTEKRNNGDASICAEGDFEQGTVLKFGFDDVELGNGVKLSGGLASTLKFKLNYYVTWTYQEVVVSLDFGGKFDISVSGKCDWCEIEMLHLALPVTWGLYISFNPNFVVESEAKITFEVSLSQKVGFMYSSNSGFSNISSNPDVDTEFSFEGKVFIGIDFGPEIEVAGGYLMNLRASMIAGVEIKGKASGTAVVESEPERYKHQCALCIDGDISFRLKISPCLVFLKSEKLKLELDLCDTTAHVFNFYYSDDLGKFGIGICPNRSYLITFQITTREGEPIPGAIIEINGISDNLTANDVGLTTCYLTAGEYSATATSGDMYCTKSFDIGQPTKIIISLILDANGDGMDDDSGEAIGVGNEFNFGDILREIESEEITDHGEVVASGFSGENVKWELYNDGFLILSGTGEMKDYSSTSYVPWHMYRRDISSIIIMEGVTNIGAWVFANCDNLTSVAIPNSVATINDRAFYDCTNLSSIMIPDSVSDIGSFAFAYCPRLTSVIIGKNVTIIGEGSFYSCASLTEVTIPDSVTTIGDGAFFSCTSMASISIGNAVDTIGEQAFYGCSSLSDLIIPNSVESIGEFAFRFCNNLMSVKIPVSVTYLGGSIFDNCENLVSVDIGDGVNSISGTFFNCKSLKNVTLGKSISYIGQNTFRDCSKLKSVVFTGNAPKFDDYAFNYTGTTAYYPANDPTWTSSVMQNYGGAITWVPYTPSEDNAHGELVAIPVHKPAVEIEAVYGGEYDTKIIEGSTTKTASFSDLVPGEPYVLLAMVSIEVDDHLALENLLFIDQAAAREDGTLSFQYVQRTPADISYVVACGASNKDLVDAEITFPEMEVDGNLQAVNPTVVYDGKTLIEGMDYVITGAVDYTEAGEYVCFIRGIYNYAGLVECSYKVKGAELENPFADVAPGSFYYEPVMWAVENGVTSGTSETTFDPSGLCLRAHVVTFLYRAAGSPVPSSTKNPFTDVKSGDFFYKPVLWAVENGITQGISNTQFGSTQACNRAAVVTFLWRAFGSPEPESANNPFADVKTTDFFYKPVLWAVENGITSGVDATHFNPAGNCNRAQVVTFLYRAYN